MHSTNEDIGKEILSKGGFRLLLFVALLFLFFENAFSQQPIAVSLPANVTGNPNSSVSVPINVGELTGRNILGYTAVLRYDNSVLNATGINAENSLSESLELDVEITNINQNGFISVQAPISSQPLTGSGLLVNLLFDVVGDLGDDSDLFLTFRFNVGSPSADITNGLFTVNSPDISVNPNELGFGETFLDSTVQRTVQIENSGTFDLTINNISISGNNATDFNLVNFSPPLVIPIGEFRFIHVQFLPGSAGTKSAELNIESNDPITPSVSIDLSGVGKVRPAPGITINPTSIDFEEVVENTSATRQLEIGNQGNAALVISNIVIENNSLNDFSFSTGQFPLTLEVGSSATFDVTFSPSSAGLSEANLAIFSNDPDQPRTDVGLAGLAIQAIIPQISVSPDTVNFANVYVDSTLSSTLAVSNTGTGQLVISQVSVGGLDADQFEFAALTLPLTLQPQSSQEIVVSFSPDTTGIKNATLDIESNDPDSPILSVPMAGDGRREPNVALDISSIQFEDVFSDSSESAFFTIRNSGNAKLDIFSIVTSGENSEDFQIQSTTPPFTLLPGDTENVEVIFSPKSSGESNAIIEIATNSPNNPIISIPVTGSSLPPPTAEIYLSTDTLKFGNVEVETDSTIELFIGNSGQGILNIESINVKKQVIGDFRFEAPGLPFIIPPGDSQKIDVTFSPNRNGFKSAALEINSNAANQPVAEVLLQGTGMLSFIVLTNIVTPGYTVVCGDSVTIEVETFIGGAVSPVTITYRVNGLEFSTDEPKFFATVPVLTDSFQINIQSFVTDGLGRMRTSSDRIIVLKPKPFFCETNIISPLSGGVTLMDSINIIVEHLVSGGVPPIFNQCRVNGIPAVQQDSVFVARIPVSDGENLIIATCLADDNCGLKAICTDSVKVMKISEASCKVEILTPQNEQFICSGKTDVKAKLKLPNVIDMLDVTAFIDDTTVSIGADSIFSAEIQLNSGRNKIVARAIIDFGNGFVFDCKDSVYVTYDDVLPVCEFWPDAGKIVGFLTDSLSGLASIEVLQLINGRLIIDEFKPGDKRIDFEVVPIDFRKSIAFYMRVTDVCGNSIVCDPVYVDLMVDNTGNRHTIDFFSVDRFFTIKNDGVEMMRCKLNQKEFTLFTEKLAGRPKPNSYQIAKYGDTTFDLSSELKEGDNVLEVQLIGFTGSSVELFLADLEPQIIDHNLKINSIPQDFELRPNYPNPFNPSTNIEFEVPGQYVRGVRVKLKIFNILGEIVNDFKDDFMKPGVYTLLWDGSNNSGQKVASGIYILHMQAGTFSKQRQMLLIK